MATPSTLHYLDAHRVANMEGVEVCTGNDQRLGTIDGFVIERDTRRLKYFVVEPEAWNERCLLPADNPAVLNLGQRKLMVDAEPTDLERLCVRSGDRPSDEEVIEAIYRHHPAA